jgi:hypothetical protein
MVKVDGPMLSFTASGTLADTVTFSTWKGRAYARTRVIPKNPQSASQTGIRQMMEFLTRQWTSISAANKASWEALADQEQVSPFNSYIGRNLSRWRNYRAPSQTPQAPENDTLPTLGTPTVTAVGRNIKVDIPITTPADGWGILIHISATNGFTPGFSTAKKTVPVPASGSASAEIGPWTPGTYYVRVVAFTRLGRLGSATSQQSVTIT